MFTCTCPTSPEVHRDMRDVLITKYATFKVPLLLRQRASYTTGSKNKVKTYLTTLFSRQVLIAKLYQLKNIFPYN